MYNPSDKDTSVEQERNDAIASMGDYSTLTLAELKVKYPEDYE